MGSSHSKELKGGYRIVKICENSPAARCDLEIFFDYIIQIDGLKIVDASRKTHESFMKKVRKNENKTIVLVVYNCRFNKTKEILLTPKKWGGNGLLGININYEPFCALNEGTRIIDILKNSPADNSDLVEQSDFIIGNEDSVLRSREDVLNYVNAKYIEQIKNDNNDKIYITFYVYNIETQKIRKVKLQPSRSWGGDGLLGCNIANGILHKIPLCQPETNPVAHKNKSDEMQMNALQETEEEKATTVTKDTTSRETVRYEEDDKNKTNDLNMEVKALNDTTVFENGKERKSNDAMSEKVPIVTDDEGKDQMKKMNGQYVNDTNEEVERQSEMQKGEKIKLDKNHNFITVKNGYSICLTSEEDVKDNEKNKKKNEKEESHVSNVVTESAEKDNEKSEISYVNFVEQMHMYTEEFDEICEGMNKNNEILSNLGLSTKIKSVSYKNESTETDGISLQENPENNKQERNIENILEGEKSSKNETNSDNIKAQKAEEVEEDRKGENLEEGEKDEQLKEAEKIRKLGEVVKDEQPSEVDKNEQIEESGRKEEIEEKCKGGEESAENIPVEENVEKQEDISNVTENVVDEKREEVNVNESEKNLKKETDEAENMAQPAEDDPVEKNIPTVTDDIDTMMNDLPKAGIIYPSLNM